MSPQILSDTGEPLDAALSLKWRHVDLERARLRMPGSSESLYPGAETTAALQQVREPQRLHVFPWPGDVDSLRQAWRHLIEQAHSLLEKGGAA